jgi:hypothetical protein
MAGTTAVKQWKAGLRAMARLGLLAALALGAAACKDEAPNAEGPKVDPQYMSDLKLWRDQRTNALTAPDGWSTLVGLHWLKLKAHYAGSERSGIDIKHGPPSLGMFSRDGERVYFTPDAGVPVTHNGEPVKGRIQLSDDRQPVPSVLVYDEGKGQIQLLWRGGRHALRVRHADADSRKNFAGIEYWPVDESWRVEGTFIPHPPGKTIEVVTVLGTTEVAPNPGVVEFQLQGQTMRLEAFDRVPEGLTLLFADATSGQGSYGQGRFIDLLPPDPQGKVVIDFNRAYNPPCAFTPFGTCPTPPKDNRLVIAVKAGEMRYAKNQPLPAAPAQAQ